jgi:hypothetical protein
MSLTQGALEPRLQRTPGASPTDGAATLYRLPQRLACGRRGGHYFARLPPSAARP